MSTVVPQVIWLGETDHSEAQPALARLRQAVPEDSIKRAAHVQQVRSWIASEQFFPDLVVVFQSWPDEYSRHDVEQLIALLPLARWVCCFSAWCESDGRSRPIWPPAVRVPARWAAARIGDELQVLANRRRALPLTGSRDEIFEFENTPAELTAAARNVAVISPDKAWREYQTDLLRVAGCQIVDAEGFTEADIVVWDGDPWDDRLAGRLQSFHRQNPQVPLILTMSFAHPELLPCVEALGVVRIVPKLSPAGTLLEALRRELSHSAHPPAQDT